MNDTVITCLNFPFPQSSSITLNSLNDDKIVSDASQNPIADKGNQDTAAPMPSLLPSPDHTARSQNQTSNQVPSSQNSIDIIPESSTEILPVVSSSS